MTGKSILIAMNCSLAKELDEVLGDLTDPQINFSAPAIDARPIVDVAIHVHRPVLAATAIITGREWPARPPWPKTAEALKQLLTDISQQVNDWIIEADERVFSRPVELRWGYFNTGYEAMINSLVHGFIHIGAIRGIRAIGGFPTTPEM